MFEPIDCGVLDTPPSRGMTVVVALRYFTVIASEAKQSISRLAETWIASSLQRKIALQFCRELLAMTEIGRRVLDTPHVWGRRAFGEVQILPAGSRTGDLTDISHGHVKVPALVRN
ncbi:hypothetical protein GWE18_05680 [Bradyrhizobium sp. CSA112]|uniref:hypothetical protein n=1 Tax=Bradyrhizobium sp. CSA112 TaxID=2699170 RepID=UPI0023B1CFAD|nr:hypothetical protein [Bradyrhizobium sp. CSA112]MDE5452368.1 hypothetical protein [Bradyrhizobium sp. CSA112]